ncbi:hypothetical protein ACFX5K_04530 [Rickettsiales bacterium LUAb2]
MYKKLFIYLLFIILIPVLSNAEEIKRSSLLSGTWFVYGFALYQPTQRTVLIDQTHAPVVYDSKMFYGGGVGKDNVRLEYAKYLNEPRFIAAYDFFPKAIATPYIGYSYGLEDFFEHDGDNTKLMKKRSDAVVGITFQPLSFASIYAEYLVRDQFFFVGMRFKLSYTLQ